ncbi:DUF1566 domain-containing protein [Alteromonas sp. 345S023]|jgi:hypothetical protein|uniref:DUF1566 domain-containing protein n=1 Tax=Alteromonas profundi TaxID=2696062 RepID=A0A7X5RJB3_9ALTE|nr:DUF1566 domain-containing protein [Alteromonas profundi]NDV89703.1 DUF1566 domain-containing protein [Alteromonas profundi]
MKNHTMISFVFIGVFFPQHLLADCVTELTESNPRSRYTDNLDGTVTDDKTGLVWMRCSTGQTWNEAEQVCQGEAAAATWLEAHKHADGHIFAGNDDWHLPNFKELISIMEIACFRPAINLEIFPNTPEQEFSAYWTSTPGDIDSVYAVTFDSVGPQYHRSKNSKLFSRLVRKQ